MPRLYVGIVYGGHDLFTTEGTEDTEKNQGLPLITVALDKQIICRFTVHSRYQTFGLGRFYSSFVEPDR